MINQVKKTLSKNYFLKLLIEGDYRWVRAGVMVAIIYYIVGVGLSISSSLLVDFLFSRYIYVLLVSIIVCLSVARWYPKALAEILSSTPDAFDVKSNVILQIIENWLPLIQLPITLFGGLALAVFAGYLSLFKSAVLGLPTDIPYWLLIYYTILIVICGIMMGGGIIVYLATMILFNKLFQIISL